MPFPSQRFEQDKEPALLDVSRIAVSLLKNFLAKEPFRSNGYVMFFYKLRKSKVNCSSHTQSRSFTSVLRGMVKQHLTERLTQLAGKQWDNHTNNNPNPQHKRQYCFTRPL